MVSLIDVFEGVVARMGSSPCVLLEDGRSFSYLDVNDFATCVAKELACAVESSSDILDDSETPLVAVMMTRGIGLASAILGILKAGAAYVPVDPAFPPDRQTHIFAHSKCKLLITDEESLQLALSLGVIVPPTLVINSNIQLIEGDKIREALITRSLLLPSFESLNKIAILSKAREKVSYREDGGLAYVLYTSGSTGKPKGVMINHAGVVNIVNWFADELRVSASSRVLGLTTFCFDISVLEMFLPLFRGAGLVMVNQSTQKDPFHLLDVIRDLQVSVMQATPTTFEMLFATGWRGDKAIDFLVGGEAFRSTLLPLAHTCRSLRNVFFVTLSYSVSFDNTDGPTETTIWSSSYTLSDSSTGERTCNADSLTFVNAVPVIPIGTPISQTDFYVVSEDETLPKTQMPLGMEGELWIGGIGVAKGYLHAPDLTKEKFFANPFGAGRVYRTGDIVVQMGGAEGDYVFIRRMDEQVKIDGFRIELAEIEAVFMTHDLVQKAVALVRDAKLVLYIKAASVSTLSAAQLGVVQAHAGRSLTYYMMPKSIVQVQSFPETANGKLDRKALPDPASSDQVIEMQSSAEEQVQPQSPCIEDTSALNFNCTRGGGESDVGAGVGVGVGVEGKGAYLNSRQRSLLDSKNVTIMVKHICDMVEQMRGRRPSSSSSFAAIGVDSLGAVMFIKFLSDSLGGIRIEPAKIYAPGVTIRTFAEGLITRLKKEKPDALLQLGINVTLSEEDRISELESGTSPRVRLDFLHLKDLSYGQGIGIGMGMGYLDGGDGGGGVADDGDGDGEGEERYRGEGLLQKLENSFEDILTSNREIIEGLRGVFTFLVLYDHFHNPHNAISSSFTSDTYLFIMISGFTTALQLREGPRFGYVDATEEQVLPTLHNLETHNAIDESIQRGRGRNDSNADGEAYNPLMSPIRQQFDINSNSNAVGKRTVEKFDEGNEPVHRQGRMVTLQLLPRTPFRVVPFILTRCVGLYPILWLAILLNTPSWVLEESADDRTSNGEKAVCAALYVVAMQSWMRPACRFYGPNNLLYASILLNCFILYSLGRVLLRTVQDRLMTWSSSVLSPITLKPPMRVLRTRTWKQWVGDMTVAISFNRIDMAYLPMNVIVWVLVSLGLFTFMLYNTFAKNALTFIAYFAVGSIAASLLESIHYAFWDWGRSHELDMILEKSYSVTSFVYRVYNYTECGPSWPWVHKCSMLSYLYPSAQPSEAAIITHNSPIKAAYSPLSASARRSSDSLDVSNSGTGSSYSGLLGDEVAEVPAPVRSTFLFLLCCNVWRFFPDLCAVGIGFLMSTLGDLNNENIKFVLWFVIVPSAYMLLILVSMLQRGSARYNLSRLFLECTPIRTLGYASYAMYLFQRIAFNCYLPCIYFGIKTGHFNIRIGDPGHWFERLPNHDKFLAVVTLTFICFLVHKYFQDRFVTYWYALITAKT